MDALIAASVNYCLTRTEKVLDNGHDHSANHQQIKEAPMSVAGVTHQSDMDEKLPLRSVVKNSRIYTACVKHQTPLTAICRASALTYTTRCTKWAKNGLVWALISYWPVSGRKACHSNFVKRFSMLYRKKRSVQNLHSGAFKYSVVFGPSCTTATQRRQIEVMEEALKMTDIKLQDTKTCLIKYSIIWSSYPAI